MDVQTIMSSLWSRRISNETFQPQTSVTTSINTSNNIYTTTNSDDLYHTHQTNFIQQQHSLQQVRISPTIAVIDAHFGLPTAAVAELPMHSKSANSVADFPPPSASLTSRSHLVARSIEDAIATMVEIILNLLILHLL